MQTLAVELGVAKNTAHRALKTLRGAGLLEHTQARAAAGRFDTSAYRLAVPDDVLTRSLRSISGRPAGRRVARGRPPAAGSRSRPMPAASTSSSSSSLSPEVRRVSPRSPIGPIRFLQTSARVGDRVSASDAAGDDDPRVVGGEHGGVLHAVPDRAPGEVPGVWSGRQAAGLGLVGHGRGASR